MILCVAKWSWEGQSDKWSRREISKGDCTFHRPPPKKISTEIWKNFLSFSFSPLFPVVPPVFSLAPKMWRGPEREREMQKFEVKERKSLRAKETETEQSERRKKQEIFFSQNISFNFLTAIEKKLWHKILLSSKYLLSKWNVTVLSLTDAL